MADKKISALTAATTPLAGSEVLPIVQGGSTVKVSIANVTAGRDVGAKNVIATGQGVFAGPLDNFWSASGALYGYYSGGGVFGSYSDAVGTLSPLSFDGSTIALRTANVSRLEVSNGGNVTARTGNLVMGTAGRGIDFSANTHAPGMTSELLNWYEEGTWTPVVSFGGGSTGVTYAVQEGHYTRIGRFVTGRFIVVLSSKGSSTGDAVVAGLPFVVGNYNGGAFTTVCSNFASNAPTQGYCNLNTNQIVPWVISGTGVTGLTDANFNNNTRLDMWFQYFV